MPVALAVILLGIIEGITEFLPISSTGHLLIAEQVLKLSGALGADHWLIKASAQKDLFNIVIQSGAVLAVLPLFRDRLSQFFFRWRETATQAYMAKLLVAFVVTCLPMYIIEKKGFKLPEEVGPVAWALLAGGIGFVGIEIWLRRRLQMGEVTWTIAFAVGIGQVIAGVFPGTSRSGATILLALILGLNRVAATEFAFLVGIPTMLAAGGWKIFKAVRHPEAGAPPQDWAMVLLGTVLAAIVSFIAVKWLLRYIQTHTFVLFGWYRIALAILIAAFLFQQQHTNSKIQTSNSKGPSNSRLQTLTPMVQ